MDRVRKKTLRQIDKRVERRPEYSGAEMRKSMREAAGLVPWMEVERWLEELGKESKGRDGLAAMTVDEIEGLLYASAWCRAYGREMNSFILEFGTGRSVQLSA